MSGIRAAKKKAAAMARGQGMLCYYCGDKMEINVSCLVKKSATVEHLVRIVDGGDHAEKNIVAACRECNNHRDEIPVEIWKLICREIIALRLRKKAFWKYCKPRTYRRQLKKFLSESQCETFYSWCNKYVQQPFLRPLITRYFKRIEDRIIYLAANTLVTTREVFT